ncbi:hypothetical protein HanXRQr2_Chr17g0821471 [Helianthus annuus]|uniref:Secreted protein n=1 Tax=Helianthus annuus TaxID=4232 RepID=A0A9K3DMJ8_HELAN|nr:hypothetical protein HanXRQr2_Chr17g0821471 [Helianthus annuus]KAJ0814721.1 hypothetical protein HanPSC8_Chr17g0789131 [Helianthus annuus]
MFGGGFTSSGVTVLLVVLRLSSSFRLSLLHMKHAITTETVMHGIAKAKAMILNTPEGCGAANPRLEKHFVLFVLLFT